MSREQMPGERTTAVDDALRTYPLAPVPASLRPRVMTRIRALAAPRFGLQFLDYAVSLFGAGMAGLALALWGAVTPQMAVRAQLQWLFLAQVLRFNALTLGPALTIGLALAALAGVTALVVLRRGPVRSVRM